MANDNISQTSPFPPPPPPPPIQPTHKINQNGQKLSNNPEHVLQQIFNLYPATPSQVIVSYNRDVKKPVIQEGPTCGIVALSMACEIIGSQKEVDDILATAKNFGFTRNGEMFSIYNMARVASSMTGRETVVVKDVISNKRDILNHIFDGLPVLIPYDADKNHTPCLNNGLSAHWAVLTGICFGVSQSNASCLNVTTDLYSGLNVAVIDDGKVANSLLNENSEVFVFARQGKSRYTAMWSFEALLSSNRNLQEVKKNDALNFVLPESGDLSELRDKALLLK